MLRLVNVVSCVLGSGMTVCGMVLIGVLLVVSGYRQIYFGGFGESLLGPKLVLSVLSVV